jgi:hypothetical protein
VISPLQYWEYATRECKQNAHDAVKPSICQKCSYADIGLHR